MLRVVAISIVGLRIEWRRCDVLVRGVTGKGEIVSMVGDNDAGASRSGMCWQYQNARYVGRVVES